MILWATGITGGFQQGSDLPFIKVTPTAVVGRADLLILVEGGGGRVEVGLKVQVKYLCVPHNG